MAMIKAPAGSNHFTFCKGHNYLPGLEQEKNHNHSFQSEYLQSVNQVQCLDLHCYYPKIILSYTHF